MGDLMARIADAADGGGPALGLNPGMKNVARIAWRSRRRSRRGTAVRGP